MLYNRGMSTIEKKTKTESWEKAQKRKARFWRTWRPFAAWLMRLVYGYRTESFTPPGQPYLLYANHVTDLDPVLVACTFPEQMAFVAGENVQRMGVLSGIIRRYGNIVERVKGTTDSAAAMQILRTLKSGLPVCMFAEGNRSFAGKTGYIHPAAAKLARMAKVPLITYRLEGGYLTTPRWATHLRKGRMHGAVVHVYPFEELRAMTNEQVQAVIDRDLYVDAYAAEPIAYRGRKLAERLETMLYDCPKCHGIDTVTSRNDTVTCTCGMTLRMNRFGRFEGESLPFAHPGEWDEWQSEWMKMHHDGLSFADADMTLERLDTETHSVNEVAHGTMTFSKEGFAVGDFSVPFAKLEGMALVQRDKLVFSAERQNYTVRAKKPYCARKYCDLYRLYKEEG